MIVHLTLHKIICKILLFLSITILVLSIIIPTFVFIGQKSSIHLAEEIDDLMYDDFIYFLSGTFSFTASLLLFLQLKKMSEFVGYRYYAILGSLELILCYFVINTMILLSLSNTAYDFIAFLILFVIPIINIILCYGKNSIYSELKGSDFSLDNSNDTITNSIENNNNNNNK